jgi:RNA polymerase sigma factor (sigma-70 family)
VFFSAVDGTLGSALATDVDGAFPALFSALAGPVYSVGLRLCGPGDAEDVAQETFARAYAALHRYPPDRRRTLEVRPWVLTIALNVARNRLRTDSRHATSREPRPIDGVDPAIGPEAAAEQSDLRERLTVALHKLPLPAREAVVLRHVVGCSVAEAAAILERPAGTVKAQVWRGLAALREDLQLQEQR